MPFIPEVDEIISPASHQRYRFVEHPEAPHLPFGQEGRASIVYKLVDDEDLAHALKVFKPRFRTPALVGLSCQIAQFAELPGLRVCRRIILTPQEHGAFLRHNPELTYAALMPWIPGPTWADILLEKRPMTPETGLQLARSLAETLSRLEQQRVAHCDLSASNVLLPALAESPEATDCREALALVDVEQIYAPGLSRPAPLTVATAGYGHPQAMEATLWSEVADRFAGALLLVEMLTWHDERVRRAASNESYFSEQDLQREGERYRILMSSLTERWGGGIASLFRRAWHSGSLHDNPTFGEWLVTLPEDITEKQPPPALDLDTLLTLARQLEDEQKPRCARELYRRAQRLTPLADSEIDIIVSALARLEGKVDSYSAEAPEQSAPAEAETPSEGAGNDVQESAQSGLGEEPTVADLFDEGLAAFQQDQWRAAQELLAEVLRQSPDYQRHGWEARKLLADAEARMITPWERLLRYGGRILLSSLLVLTIVSLIFTGLYIGLVRPVVTDALFTVMRPMLNELTALSGEPGCVTNTAPEINAGLERNVPYLVAHNDLRVSFQPGSLRGSGTIGDITIWLQATVPEEVSVFTQRFQIEALDMHWLLQLLFTREQLKTFIERYVNEELMGMGPDKIRRLEIRVDDQVMEVCAW